MTMTENEAKRNVVELLAEAMAEVGAIPKSRQMTEGQSYSYRGQADILAKVQPVFARLQIVAVPTVLERTVSEVIRGNNKVWWHVVMRVRWRFYGPLMDCVECETYGEGLDNGDKGSNKAMTASHKYALISVLQLAEAGADPDQHQAPEREYREPEPEQIMPGRIWPKIARRLGQLLAEAGVDASPAEVAETWHLTAPMTEADLRAAVQRVVNGEAPAPLAQEPATSDVPPAEGPCEQCGHVGPLVSWTPEETGVAQLVCADEPACLARLEERQGASA